MSNFNIRDFSRQLANLIRENDELYAENTYLQAQVTKHNEMMSKMVDDNVRDSFKIISDLCDPKNHGKIEKFAETFVKKEQFLTGILVNKHTFAAIMHDICDDCVLQKMDYSFYEFLGKAMNSNPLQTIPFMDNQYVANIYYRDTPYSRNVVFKFLDRIGAIYIAQYPSRYDIMYIVEEDVEQLLWGQIMLSTVRQNIIKDKNYTPYCGNVNCRHNMPRTVFKAGQFECRCGWRSEFEAEFINEYRGAK